MKIEMEDLSPVRKKLKIEIPQEETLRAYEEVSRKIASLARIPGFRPGKAPLALVRNRFKNEIKDEVVHDLLPKSYDEAIKAKELKPLARPHIERLDFHVGEPLMYEAVFEVTPEFKLGEYRGLTLQKSITTVTDEDVDKVLAQLQENLAKFVPIEHRPATASDQLRVDIEGTYITKETNEPTAEPPLREDGVALTLDSPDTLPEFSDSLKGAQIGETREFVVTYPDDFPRKELAGKSVKYRATIRGIKEKKLPQLDNEFVKELGEDCETLDQFRSKLHQDLERRRERALEDSLHEQAVAQLLERNQFEVPDLLIEERIQYKLHQFAHDMARRGLDVSRTAVNWSKLRDELREPSRREVRTALILDCLARAEGLEPEEKEVDQELERIAKAQGQSIEKVALQYEKENRMEELRDRLRSRKAMAFVLGQANIRGVAS